MTIEAAAAPPREKPPMPTGLDKVFAQNMIGNLKFPQMALTISIFTMDAILSDPDWKKLLAKYRQQPITNAMAKRMREIANGAHAKHLPPGTAPELSLGRMKKLWKAEKKHIDGFLYHVLAARPGEAPSDELDFLQTFRLNWALSKGKLDAAMPSIVGITRALKGIVSQTDVAEHLQGYRSLFKKTNWKETGETRMREREVHDELIRKLREQIAADTSLDQAVVARVMDFLSRPWS